MSTQAYPLQWPSTHRRTPAINRKIGRFSKRENNRGWTEAKDLSIFEAIGRLQSELERLGASNYVLSSNVETRLDGLPRSGQRNPDDPGVALYFSLSGEPHCLPCDTFTMVAQNIAAIAKHIEATRSIERYGVASVREMFTGFAALPAPPGARSWWEVLGVSENAGKIEISSAYRTAARKWNENGGSQKDLKEINLARDEGMRLRP